MLLLLLLLLLLWPVLVIQRRLLLPGGIRPVAGLTGIIDVMTDMVGA